MTTAQRLRIGPADHGRRMTLDEFLEAKEQAGYRYELAEGVLEVVHLPKTPQRQIVSNLYDVASDYKRRHPGLINYYGGGSEVRIWLPAKNMGRHPDLGIVFVGAPIDLVGDLQVGLAAEVVSESSKVRDYQTKRQEYLWYGIQEYWIVDPYLRRLTLLVRQGEGDEAGWVETVLEDEDVIASALLPGLTARVSDLWAGVDLDQL